jgi:hypothetical protein
VLYFVVLYFVLCCWEDFTASDGVLLTSPDDRFSPLESALVAGLEPFSVVPVTAGTAEP